MAADVTQQTDALAAEISQCRICVEQPMKNPLPHPPRPVAVLSSTARICICGQAPGVRVHRCGRPFADPSGDRLRQWLAIDEQAFYDASKLAIVPMGFCFPGHDAKGGDLPPRRECRANWHDQVFASMPQLELLIAIGQYAQHYWLAGQRRKNLTETVSAWCEIANMPNVPMIFPLPHPSWRNNAWIKKNPWFNRELVPELQRQVGRLI